MCVLGIDSLWRTAALADGVSGGWVDGRAGRFCASGGVAYAAPHLELHAVYT
jgi:hypothetical protein